jgi:murein L,D-transpeptidase YcbB/YkuD
MAENGRLPDSALAPIAGGRLEKSAAAAWNAMSVECRRRFGADATLLPTGSKSSYRTYAQQVELWELYQRKKGNEAARPGTSNHGLGLAVDVKTEAMRKHIDAIGRGFGWSKEWSDAPKEWWHLKYRAGIWSGPDPGADGGGAQPVVKGVPGIPQLNYVIGPAMNQRVPAVKVLQTQLQSHGHPNLQVDGVYGPETQAVVEQFQKNHGLAVDGIVGPETWKQVFSQ